MKTYKEDFEYAIIVLTEQLEEDAGKYFAQEMLQRRSDAGDTLSMLFGTLTKDSSVDKNVYALNNIIQFLTKMKDNEEVPARDPVEEAAA